MTNEEATKAMAEIVEELCSSGEWSWGDGYDIGEGSDNPEAMRNFHHFFWACQDSILIASADGGNGGDFLTNILADNLKNKTLKLVEESKNEDT